MPLVRLLVIALGLVRNVKLALSLSLQEGFVEHYRDQSAHRRTILMRRSIAATSTRQQAASRRTAKITAER